MAFKKIILVAWFALLTLSTSAYAQKVTINLRNASLYEVFRSIESQTKLSFAYNQTQFDVSNKISISASNIELKDLLDEVLKGTGYSFVIQKKHILIMPDKNPKQIEHKEKLYALKGTVLDSLTQRPLSFAAIHIDGQEQRKAYSNTQGKFVIGNVRHGVYSLSVSSDNYIPKEFRVEVSALKDTDITVVLAQPRIERKVVLRTISQKTQSVSDSMLRYEYKYAPLADIKSIKNNLAVRSSGKDFSSISPKWAVKTNILYDATTTMNLGVEFRVSDMNTVDLSVNYNPWTFSDNKKLSHTAVQAEFRKWLCNPFQKHFFGVHLTYARFNWGGVRMPLGLAPNLEKNRYQGNWYSVGVSYGYDWMLSNRLGLEATIGVGYAYIDYNKYECRNCGRYAKQDHSHYFGPTKAGISLMYFIK